MQCLVNICYGRRAMTSSTTLRTIFRHRRWLRAPTYGILYDLLNDWSGLTRTEAARKLHGNRGVSVQSSHNLSKTQQMFHGFPFLQQFNRNSCVCCTVIARLWKTRARIVQYMYDMSTGYRHTHFKMCIPLLLYYSVHRNGDTGSLRAP